MTMPRKKKMDITPKEELLKLDKQDLIARVMQLEAHILQLRNIESKKLDTLSEVSDTKKVKKDKKEPDKWHYRRVLLRIHYFGWDYNGLPVQEDTKTIEHHLFHALMESRLIQSRETSNYYCCGRTDKGVSAFGQVISISLRSKFPVSQQFSQQSLDNEILYCYKLNSLLPKDIKVVAWFPIPEDMPNFSARHDCKKRTYKYYFPRSSLNIQAMRSACTRLVGSNDYRNLCTMDVGNGVVQFRREILKADILPVNNLDSELPTSMYYLLIEGNAFLLHQIRYIMAVLLLIGQGKETPEVISELLDVEKHPRKPQYNMALDVPLNLFHCSYDLPGSGWRMDKQQLSIVLSQLQKEWTIQNIKTTMIKEVINELESQYLKLCDGDIKDSDIVMAYTDCLLPGPKPKVYIPLLDRATCSSLEEKIEHHKRKRKVPDTDDVKKLTEK